MGNDGSSGDELWRSDGTPSGTYMVADIIPGWGGVFSASYTPIPQLLTVGNRLFFRGHNETNGIELWTSDGTAAGTMQVKDVAPGTESGILTVGHVLASMGNTVYFIANDGVHGTELWRSDGTDAGTMLVKDIYPGNGSGVSYFGLTVYRDNLYFAANDGVSGYELWRSDGTETGTVRVKDIHFGSGGSVPYLGSFYSYAPLYSSVFTEALYFTALDDVHGRELWRTDGTEAGTYMVADIATVKTSASNPSEIVTISGVHYFTAFDGFRTDLWRSDGTGNGTYRVKEISPGVVGGLIAVGNTLYFHADDEVHGAELWKSDGTENGTVLVKDTAVP